MRKKILFELVGNYSWRLTESKESQKYIYRLHEAEELREEGSLEEAAQEFRALINEAPDLIEAYNDLYVCHKYLGNNFEALAVLEAAVNYFHPYVPQQLLDNQGELLWGFLENRPLMRLYGNLAMEHFHQKDFQSAKKLMGHLLSWNPNDNQGMREYILACNMELGLIEESINLCKQYPDDIMPATVYGHPLLLMMQEKETEARKFLSIAIERCPKVARELLKSKHKPPKSLNEGFITIGGEDEAYLYWKTYAKYWKRTKGAMLLLKKLRSSTLKKRSVAVS